MLDIFNTLTQEIMQAVLIHSIWHYSYTPTKMTGQKVLSFQWNTEKVLKYSVSLSSTWLPNTRF